MDSAFFEEQRKPKSWDGRQRFLFICTRNRHQYKRVVQIDLFIPYKYGYDFKVIVTNKSAKAKKSWPTIMAEARGEAPLRN